MWHHMAGKQADAGPFAILSLLSTGCQTIHYERRRCLCCDHDSGIFSAGETAAVRSSLH
jgi:hypothetical protein